MHLQQGATKQHHAQKHNERITRNHLEQHENIAFRIELQQATNI